MTVALQTHVSDEIATAVEEFRISSARHEVAVVRRDAPEPCLRFGQTLPDDAERQLGVELLARIGAGDEAALASFYDRYSPTFYGIALRMMRDEKEAEDVLQEAFVYLWRRAASYDAQLSSPSTWAVMILRNKAIDRLRSRQRIERIVARATAEFCHHADTDERSAEEPLFRERRGIVRAALAALPAEQRQALELAFFSGLTHDEIAAQLATPLGTIKARIRRGLLRMRDQVMEAR